MYCRKCGAEMIPLLHLKKSSTYRKTCDCPVERRGNVANHRKKTLQYSNDINAKTRSAARSIFKRYTEKDLDFIKKNLMSMTYEQMAYSLGRTRASVVHKVFRLREQGVIDSWFENRIQEAL